MCLQKKQLHRVLEKAGDIKIMHLGIQVSGINRIIWPSPEKF